MKIKNVLMISFLAIAGIFGASSAIVNNEVKETPVVEKAEASTSGTRRVFLVDQINASGSDAKLYLSTTQQSLTSKLLFTSLGTVNNKPVYYADASTSTAYHYVVRTASNGTSIWNYSQTSFTLSDTVNEIFLYGWDGNYMQNSTANSYPKINVGGTDYNMTWNPTTEKWTYSFTVSAVTQFYVKANMNDLDKYMGYVSDVSSKVDGCTQGDELVEQDGHKVYKLKTPATKRRYTVSIGSSNIYTYGDPTYDWGTTSSIEHVDRYTISFNANGHGTAPSSQTVDSGAKLSNPGAPTGTTTGYTFGGWYKEEGCINAWNFSTDTVTASRTLYAKWTANTYTITVDLDGGSGQENTSYTYSPSAQNVVLATPTKTGKDFAGYTVTSGPSTGTASFDDTTLQLSAGAIGAITVTATWTDGTYTINYNANGGSAAAPASQTPGVGTVVTFRTYSGTKTGHTFNGWNTDPSGTGTHYAAGGTGTPTTAKGGTLTLYAEWNADTYTVTLNKNGGTINSGNITSYTYGVGATLPTDVTKYGYNFGGWYANGSLTGDRQYSISTTATGNKSYWAKWNEYNDFWVSFDGGNTKIALQTVSGESAANTLYQLNTSSPLTLWASQTISFYRGVTANTATIVSSNDIAADAAANLLSTTAVDNKWNINNYAVNQTLYFKVFEQGQSTPFGFYIGGKQSRSSTTTGVTSGTTFYIQDLIKKNGGNTNYSADNAKLAVYFYNPVGEGVNVDAWSTTFATRIKTNTPTGVDLYSITVPQFNGANMTWGSVIVCRFYSSATTSDISFDSNKRIANNGAKLTSFNSGVENMIQITAWSGSGDSNYPSPCNSTMYTDGGLRSGTGVYVDISGLNYGAWTIDNTRHLYVYFFSIVDGDGDAHAWSSALTVIPGKANFYECQVPQYDSENVEWAKLIVVNNTTPAFVQGLNHYQTQDMWYSSAIRDHQLITFTGSQTSEAKVEASNNNSYQDADRAETWGKNFYLTNVVCDGEGSITTDNWTTSKNDYNAAASSVKTLITNATASESNYLGKAVGKYDYIVHKYGTGAHEDYASRISGGHFTYGSIGNFSPYSLIMGSEDNTTTIIIIIAASVSLLSITALSILLVKKRKRVDN